MDGPSDNAEACYMISLSKILTLYSCRWNMEMVMDKWYLCMGFQFIELNPMNIWTWQFATYIHELHVYKTFWLCKLYKRCIVARTVKL